VNGASVDTFWAAELSEKANSLVLSTSDYRELQVSTIASCYKFFFADDAALNANSSRRYESAIASPAILPPVHAA